MNTIFGLLEELLLVVVCRLVNPERPSLNMILHDLHGTSILRNESLTINANM